MRNLSVVLLLLVSISFSAFAKATTGSIKGQFIEENGDPAAFTTVVLLNTDSVLVKVDYTNEHGAFSFINIAPGKYRIKNSSLQNQDFVTDFFELNGGDELNLGVISLAAAVTELEAVEVRALKPLVEVHPDKTVFNVSSGINAAGSDAMETLRKAPGVVIDNNDNIILQGKSGVRIYIDGKESHLRGEDLTSMLRNMSADQIESIEVITNPSAKYDAAGGAGIINIKLIRDKNLGFNATVSGQANVGQRESYNGSVNFNFRDRKSNLYGHYNYHDNQGLNYEDLEKRLQGLFMLQESNHSWNHAGHDFRAGYDYFINKNQTIGAVVEGNFSDNSGASFSRTPIQVVETGQVNDILVSESSRTGNTDNFKINLNYQLKSEKGNNLNFDADYGQYEMRRASLMPNAYFNPDGSLIVENNYSDNQRTRIDIRTLKGDYETNLFNGKWTSGFKISSVGTQNAYKFFMEEDGVPVPDLDRTSDFDYEEIVYAAYTSYNGQFSKKASYNLGLRVEHTESEGILSSEQNTGFENVKRSYTDLFPSGGVSYEINENNKLSTNYSRRIDRPNYQHLNPFEFKLDEITFRRGNPFLNPQYTHNFQLNHSFKHKLNTALTYSITDDFFAQIVDTTGERGSMISQQNLADARNLNLNVSYNTDITKWWNVFTNINIYNADYKTTLEVDQIDVNVTAYNVYLQNNFMLPAKFRVEVSGWYNSPSVWGGTFKSKEMWSVDLGLKRSFWDDKCMLTMGLQDVFKSQIWGGHSNYNGLEVSSRGGWDSRRFRVKLDIRLGNQNVKGARNRKTGLEEEAKRANSGS